jgi:hypothetical protein
MAKPKIRVDSLHLNFTIHATDLSDEKNPKPFHIQESPTFTFGDPGSLDATLTKFPWLADLVPALIENLLKSYDPASEKAKVLLASVKQFISTE